MALAFLILITLGFLILNAYIAKFDYLHPMVILGFTFLFSEIMCLLGIETYSIHMHIEIVFVLLIGFSALTLGNIIGQTVKVAEETQSPRYIYIEDKYAIITIVMQIIAIFSLIRYFRALSAAYSGMLGGSFTSLPQLIRLFNNLTNFWQSTLAQLNVSIPLAYRLLDPISGAAAYIFIYVLVNNYVVTHKVNKYHVLILILLCFEQMLNSSRTPLVNILMMIIILLHIFKFRSGTYILGSLKGLIKLISVIFAVGILSILGLSLIGRKLDQPIFNYIFNYTGAPLLNLDTFLSKRFDGQVNQVIGLSTFGNLYRYIAKLFHLDATKLAADNKVFLFYTSENGLNTGNVFTMFYPFIKDFSYFGVFPLSFIMSYLLCKTYRVKLFQNFDSYKVDFGLLIFSYLYNSAVMPFFAEKFFETLGNPPFIKMFIISYVFTHFSLKGSKVLITTK